MKLPSHKLLKFITSNREVSLLELIPLVEKKFCDYRDYYPLSHLCIDGYVKCEHSINGEPHKDEKVLASIFYSCATGTSEVNNFISSRKEVTPEVDKFYATAKGELYFAESRAKRSDRIYSMAIGIIVGLCTAVLMVELNIK